MNKQELEILHNVIVALRFLLVKNEQTMNNKDLHLQIQELMTIYRSNNS